MIVKQNVSQNFSLISERMLGNILLGILLVSLLSYEAHLYPLYRAMTALVLLTGIAVALLLARSFRWGDVFKSNSAVLVLLLVQLVAGIGSMVLYGDGSLGWVIQVASTFLSFAVFYLMFPVLTKETSYRILKSFFLVATLASVFSIVLMRTGSLFGYSVLWGTRSQSVFFDANYYGGIAGVSAAFFFFYHCRGWYIYFAINVCGVVSSGSRGALLALLAALMFGLFRDLILRHKAKPLFLAISALCVVFLGLHYLGEIGFFRSYQGSSGRLDMWILIIPVLMDSFFFGYGYGSAPALIRRYTLATNGSLHNAYLDHIASYGFISFFIYIYMIAKCISRAFFNDRIGSAMLCCSVALIVNAMTISINLGGVGILSLLLSLLLGWMNVDNQSQLPPQSD